MTEQIYKKLIVTPELSSHRIDRAAVALLPQYSRARIQAWIRNGELLVNGALAKPKQKVMLNDELELKVTLQQEGNWHPEPIAINVLFEDEHLLVINKSANVVVHPAPGHSSGTLVNAVLHHCPQLRQLPRAGIVHRLDKDTTGLIVIAKTLEAHQSLVRQLQERTMGREYEAVVQGELTGGGKVDAAIGRNPGNRLKMAVVAGGKPAVTHYRLLKRYPGFTHLRLKLETGRTHQIRVHMAHIHHPLVGDPAYAGRARTSKGISPVARAAVADFPRQALHAKALTLNRPVTGEELTWEVALPADMLALLTAIGVEG